MGKYVQAETDINLLLSQVQASGLKTFPSSFEGEKGPPPYIRATIVPSGPPLNASSSSGVLLVEIFTAWGAGPRPASIIADQLDGILQRVTVGNTQLFNSSLDRQEKDKDNAGLARVIYSVPYSHFGVN